MMEVLTIVLDGALDSQGATAIVEAHGGSVRPVDAQMNSDALEALVPSGERSAIVAELVAANYQIVEGL